MVANPLGKAFPVTRKHRLPLMCKELFYLHLSILDWLFQRQGQSPSRDYSLRDHLHFSLYPQMKRNPLLAILRNPYQVSIHQYNTLPKYLSLHFCLLSLKVSPIMAD